jgi:hypothetical protein
MFYGKLWIKLLASILVEFGSFQMWCKDIRQGGISFFRRRSFHISEISWRSTLHLHQAFCRYQDYRKHNDPRKNEENNGNHPKVIQNPQNWLQKLTITFWNLLDMIERVRKGGIWSDHVGS